MKPKLFYTDLYVEHIMFIVGDINKEMNFYSSSDLPSMSSTFLENCQEFSRIFTSRSRSRSILISLFTSRKRVKAFFFHFALLEKEWKHIFFTLHFSKKSESFFFSLFTSRTSQTHSRWGLHRNDQNISLLLLMTLACLVFIAHTLLPFSNFYNPPFHLSKSKKDAWTGNFWLIAKQLNHMKLVKIIQNLNWSLFSTIIQSITDWPSILEQEGHMSWQLWTRAVFKTSGNKSQGWLTHSTLCKKSNL